MIFLLTLFAAAFAQDLDATSFITKTSTEGIEWSYQISNPNLANPGKYYYVLTDDSTTLTEDGVRAGASPLNGNANCAGSVNQQDEEFHPSTLNCPLEIGVNYKFWIVVDTDGNGADQVMTPPGGIPLTVIAPTDCDGVWSNCGSNCFQTFTVTQWNAGGGAQCEFGDEEERACTGGDCPAADTDCVGAWGTCGSDCMQVYAISTPQAGSGAACEAAAEATQACTGGSCVSSVTGTYSGTVPSTSGFTFNYNLLTPAADASKNWYYCLTAGTTTTLTNDQIKAGGSNCVCSGSVSQIPNNGANQVTCSPALTAGSQYTLSAVVGDDTSVNTIGSTSVITIPGGTPASGDYEMIVGGKYHYCEFNEAEEGVNDPENEQEGGEIEEAGDIETEGGETEIGVLGKGNQEIETETEEGETETETEPLEPGESESEIETEEAEEAEEAEEVEESEIEGEESEIEEGEEEELEDGVNAVGYGTIIYLKDPANPQLSTADPATCAGWVNANRAAGGGCSKTFYTGGRTQVCGCVREGQMCDMDESEMGHSVYQLTNPATPPTLKKTHTEAPASGPVEFFGVPMQYLIPVGVLVGFGLGLGCSRKRQNQMEDYHIQLDDEVQWGV